MARNVWVTENGDAAMIGMAHGKLFSASNGVRLLFTAIKRACGAITAKCAQRPQSQQLSGMRAAKAASA